MTRKAYYGCLTHAFGIYAVNAMIALTSENKAIIQAIVQGVPSFISTNSKEERIPLPYWSAPIKADADPVRPGTVSRAAAVAVAAIMPFIDKKINTVITIITTPPTPSLAAAARINAAAVAIISANVSKLSRE